LKIQFHQMMQGTNGSSASDRGQGD
jgi:hypothetical protein